MMTLLFWHPLILREKLVTCDENQKTIVWDLDKLKRISVGPNALNSLTFSPDRKNVLSTSRYSKIAKEHGTQIQAESNSYRDICLV